MSGSPKVGEKMHGTASVRTQGHVEVRYRWSREKVAKDGFEYFVPIKDGDTATLAVPEKATGHPLKLTATLSNRAGSVELDKTTADVDQ